MKYSERDHEVQDSRMEKIMNRYTWRLIHLVATEGRGRY